MLRHLVRRSGDNPIEEMTSGAVLDFEDPGVGVEAEFPREAFLDLCLRSGLLSVAPAEQPVRWMRVVEDALRRGPEQLRRAVESVQLHEDGPSFLSTAPPHSREYSLGMAAANVRGDPDGRLQAHASFSFIVLAERKRSIHHVRDPGREPRPFLMIRSRSIPRDWILFQRSASHRRELARDAVGSLARDRQLALALELFDRCPGIAVDDSGRPDLPITVVRKRSLQGDDAVRRCRPFRYAIA